VSKVIIFSKFIGKLHLPLFFLSLTINIIRIIIIIVVLDFGIILPTLMIITLSFPLVPFRFIGYHFGLTMTVKKTHLPFGWGRMKL
jgi:hypothetical protein